MMANGVEQPQPVLVNILVIMLWIVKSLMCQQVFSNCSGPHNTDEEQFTGVEVDACCKRIRCPGFLASLLHNVEREYVKQKKCG